MRRGSGERVNRHGRNPELPELPCVIVHPHQIHVPHGGTPLAGHVVKHSKKSRVSVFSPDGSGTRTDAIQVHHCLNPAGLFRVELFCVEFGPLHVVFLSCKTDKNERVLMDGSSKSLEETGQKGCAAPNDQDTLAATPETGMRTYNDS